VNSLPCSRAWHFFERSLRVDTRRSASSCSFGLMVVIYAAVIFTVRTSDWFGGPRHTILSEYCYSPDVHDLLALKFFSTVDPRKRKRDTLDDLDFRCQSLLGFSSESRRPTVQGGIPDRSPIPFYVAGHHYGSLAPIQISGGCTLHVSGTWSCSLSVWGLFCSTTFVDEAVRHPM